MVYIVCAFTVPNPPAIVNDDYNKLIIFVYHHKIKNRNWCTLM